MLPSQFEFPTLATPCERTYWVVEHALLAGAYPGHPEPEKHQQRLEHLYRAGVRTFINLQEENETNNVGKPFVRYDEDFRGLAESHKERIAHLRFPIVDGSITTTDRMTSILDAIDLSLAAGRPVYVHCFGGMGRTGTAICCWLLRHNFATHANVFDTLTRLRQADVARASWKAPENASQEAFVTAWR